MHERSCVYERVYKCVCVTFLRICTLDCFSHFYLHSLVSFSLSLSACVRVCARVCSTFMHACLRECVIHLWMCAVLESMTSLKCECPCVFTCRSALLHLWPYIKWLFPSYERCYGVCRESAQRRRRCLHSRKSFRPPTLPPTYNSHNENTPCPYPASTRAALYRPVDRSCTSSSQTSLTAAWMASNRLVTAWLIAMFLPLLKHPANVLLRH